MVAAALTDFELDFERLKRDIAEASTHDIEQATLQAYRWYSMASLGGRASDFAEAERVTRETIARFGPREDLCLLKANLDFRFHRLPQARADLEGMKQRSQARSILADLDFQEGRYQEARLEYEALIALDPVWDDMARLAHFHWKMGDRAVADEWFERAEDELTAKQMRSFAWVELQRGVLDLTCGDFSAARGHYERATRAYSGYWLVEEHMAELLAAEERFDEAEVLYLKSVKREPRPELLQTVGELYLAMGLLGEANGFLDRALAAYLDTAHRHEVHYWHHLCDFYSDVRPDGVQAVEWATKDLQLRSNFNTQMAMSLALHVANRSMEGISCVQQSLASGVRDAHLYHQASMVFRGAGKHVEAEDCERAGACINPQLRRFHVHR